ncbi:hypothetical protein, partial [Pseudomonas sp. FG-3G]
CCPYSPRPRRLLALPASTRSPSLAPPLSPVLHRRPCASMPR